MEKGELGENFNFHFPFLTGASHSRDIEPCHLCIRLLSGGFLAPRAEQIYLAGPKRHVR